MALERTFSIIKPDATRRNLTGKINAKFEEAGLRIVAQKRIHMTKAHRRNMCMRNVLFTTNFANLCPLLPSWFRF